MCSRVAIKGTADNGTVDRTWLDEIASVQIPPDHALLGLKNGTQKRIGFIKDFRVLYLVNSVGASDKP